MTVIAVDLVPVEPYTMDFVFMGVGQRYDVIIEASQPVANYWFNVTFAGTPLCGISQILAAISPPTAIFEYEGAGDAYPTNQGSALPDSLCEDSTGFIPTVPRSAPAPSFTIPADHKLEFNFTTQQWGDQQRIYWQIGGSDMNISWSDPTLQSVANGQEDFPSRDNIFRVPESNKVGHDAESLA
jgi:FtsP/CotA-like multicopper oxidase with cupredoxin domain